MLVSPLMLRPGHLAYGCVGTGFFGPAQLGAVFFDGTPDVYGSGATATTAKLDVCGARRLFFVRRYTSAGANAIDVNWVIFQVDPRDGSTSLDYLVFANDTPSYTNEVTIASEITRPPTVPSWPWNFVELQISVTDSFPLLFGVTAWLEFAG